MIDEKLYETLIIHVGIFEKRVEDMIKEHPDYRERYEIKAHKWDGYGVTVVYNNPGCYGGSDEEEWIELERAWILDDVVYREGLKQLLFKRAEHQRKWDEKQRVQNEERDRAKYEELKKRFEDD